jgi:hypothetical protein
LRDRLQQTNASEVKANGAIKHLNGESNAIPLASLIRVGKREMTFEDVLKAHDRLLRDGVAKYGSRAEKYEDNLHQATLALWNTISANVRYSEFRKRFFKEMRTASRNDSFGKHRFEWHAVRIDSQNANWHNMIPDKRTSLNMHLMAKPSGRKSSARLPERRDPKEVWAEYLKRRRLRRAEGRRAYRQAQARLLEQRLERSGRLERMITEHLLKIKAASEENPFLFRPSMLNKTTGSVIEGANGTIRIRMEHRTVRLLMGRAAPIIPEEVKAYPIKKLSPQELEPILGIIERLKSDFSVTQMCGYLCALKEKVRAEAAIPGIIQKEIEKLASGIRFEYVDPAEGEWDPDEVPF